MRTRIGNKTQFGKQKTFKNMYLGRPTNQSAGEYKFHILSNRIINPRNKSNKTYAEQTEGIAKSELDRRKSGGECQRCPSHGDRM